jgi:hypothetical protein
MWWLIPVGYGLKWLYDAVTEDERGARRRWENKRAAVEKTIDEHRKNIEGNIARAQNSYNYHFLIDLHFSSAKVADSAYGLLDDARSSLDAMNKMLIKSKEQRAKLEYELENPRRPKDTRTVNELKEQLKIVSEIRKNVFEDRDKVQDQQETFFSEVKRLNIQTKELKNLIRDRCGYKGQEWYKRLEARKRARKLSEGCRSLPSERGNESL